MSRKQTQLYDDDDLDYDEEDYDEAGYDDWDEPVAGPAVAKVGTGYCLQACLAAAAAAAIALIPRWIPAAQEPQLPPRDAIMCQS
jgi:hypothetical protein